MHNIMVLNAKGGCGKTTIATTLACYFAGQGYRTALMDFDPQQSSNLWLGLRSPQEPPIKAIDGVNSRSGMTRSWQLYGGSETEIAIIDTPAGVTGGKLVDLYNRADSILIPVMPSVIDLHAMQAFMGELGRLIRKSRYNKRIGIIVNRVGVKSRSYDAIERLMEDAGLPLISVLRDTHNYAAAMEAGLGICELQPGISAEDRKHWEPILEWLQQEIPYRQHKLDLPPSSRYSWPSAVA